MHGFDPRKPLSYEIKLHLNTELEAAIEFLKQQPGGSDNAIHKARKKLKSCRATLRLCRDIAPRRFKAATRRLGLAARGIAGARDAAALIECAEWLEPYLAENDAAQLCEEMKVRLQERYRLKVEMEGGLETQIVAATTLCRITSHALKNTPDKEKTKPAAVLAAGWIRRHKAAVRALAACKLKGAENDFHNLRKCTQQTVYQAQLLKQAWPTGFKAIEAEAQELASLLGHEHDLTLLLMLEKTEPRSICHEGARNQLLDLLEKRRSALRSQAIKIANRLYRGYWKNEAKRIKRLWDVTR